MHIVSGLWNQRKKCFNNFHDQFVNEYLVQKEMDGITAAEARYTATVGQDIQLQQAVENFTTANTADQTTFEQITETNTALQKEFRVFKLKTSICNNTTQC